MMLDNSRRNSPRYWRTAIGTPASARKKKTSMWPSRMIGLVVLR
ncbi:hypothetical protein OSI81_06320 [Mycobacterium ulcerans]